MAPPIAFTIPIFLAYRTLGVHDTITGLVLIYLTFNLALVDLDDADVLRHAARLAGGSGVDRRLQRLGGAFARMCHAPDSPRVWPPPPCSVFIYSWNDFFFSLILTRTKAMTAPVAIVNFMQYEGWEWGRSRPAARW